MKRHCDRNKERKGNSGTTQACRSRQRPGYHEGPQNKACQITNRFSKRKWGVN